MSSLQFEHVREPFAYLIIKRENENHKVSIIESKGGMALGKNGIMFGDPQLYTNRPPISANEVNYWSFKGYYGEVRRSNTRVYGRPT
jgi:hypothetical protein